jgi:hypothetical protein
VKFFKSNLLAVAPLIVALVIVPTSVAKAGNVISPNVTNLGLDFKENSELGRMPSVIFAQQDINDQRSWLICDTINDKLCTDAPGFFGFSNFDICTDSSSFSCVAGIWAVDASGNKTLGTYQKSLPADTKYDVSENAAIGLPKSRGLGSLWKIPGVLNSAGKDTYFVAAQATLGQNKPTGTPITSTNINMSELVAGILPVSEISGSYRLLEASDAKHGGQAWGSNGTQLAPDGTTCAATDISICEDVVQFPAGYRFGMTIRLGNKVSGWFHGRITAPSILTSDWKKGEEISIEADPVKVPSLNFTVPNSEIPEVIKKLVFDGNAIGMAGDGKGSTKIVENLSGPKSLELVSGFAPAYKDKATTTDTYWSFRTLNYGSDNSVQKCSDNSGKLAGLVTTNALSYAAGPPVFNKATGTLQYKVASPHFEANGDVASGSYDLSLRSDVARCVYGFSKAPINAEISIVSQDGEAKIATTVVGERDGWLYLSAKGFTFSSPTITVKLSQEGSKSVAKNSPALKTISCSKGKLIKKVTGASPKCPSGYKAK